MQENSLRWDKEVKMTKHEILRKKEIERKKFQDDRGREFKKLCIYCQNNDEGKLRDRAIEDGIITAKCCAS